MHGFGSRVYSCSWRFHSSALASGPAEILCGLLNHSRKDKRSARAKVASKIGIRRKNLLAGTISLNYYVAKTMGKDTVEMYGHLTACANMPCGNARILDICAGRNPPEVHFTPSPAGGPEAMWFLFRIKAGKGQERVRCVLHFVENLLGGRPADFLPVYKTGGGGWKRVSQIKTGKLPDGRKLVYWSVPIREGKADVSLCYPYGTEHLEDLIENVYPRLYRDFIGITEKNNLISRVVNGYGAPGSATPGVYCVARQHSGETPGSWMLDGFLRRMADEGRNAPLVWAVPFADPDGVIAGHYGKDRFPYDFNRAWGSKLFPKKLHNDMGTHPMRHEIKCVQNDMVRWSKRCLPILVLDFHAPAMCNAEGILCYLRCVGADGRPDGTHKPWIEVFETALGRKLAAKRFIRSGQYSSRWNTARIGDFANRALKIPHITFEVPYTRSSELVFSKDDYRRAGKKIAGALIERSLNL